MRCSAANPAAEALCVKCHDPDNSPHFKFEEYWPRVEHGLDKAATRPK